MNSSEAKAKVKSRNPGAVVRKALVRLAWMTEPRPGIYGLRHESYEGFTVFESRSGLRPLGSGRTIDEAWLDTAGMNA